MRIKRTLGVIAAATLIMVTGCGNAVDENVEKEILRHRKALYQLNRRKEAALKDNKHVAFAIYEPYGGFHQLKSLQVMGLASMIEPFTEEYLKIMEHKKIPVEAMKKLPMPMNLIKIAPESYDLLDSDLKKDGFGNRQHLEV